MSAIAHARRPVLELMLQMVPEVLAERYLFGFSVLSAAVLKDDADMLLHLLAELPAKVVDTLATEPVLSPEEAKYRRAGAKALEVNLVTLPCFTLGSMPGFTEAGIDADERAAAAHSSAAASSRAPQSLQ